MNPPNPYSMTNDVESSMLSESKQFTNQFKKNHCSSPYSNSAFETCKTRNKLKQKIDSIFGATFSARKGRSTSSNIKERAKKLH